MQLRDLFGINTLTALWCLGESLADFCNNRMFILYGSGGIGKSVIVKIFKEVAGQKTHDLKNKYIIKDSRSSIDHITSKCLLESASSRMVFFPDFEAKSDQELNTRTVKALTGDDMQDNVAISVTVIGLYTLFLRRLREVVRLVCLDDKASKMDCVSATMILCWYFGIGVDDMSKSLFRVGSDCAVYAWGKNYIASIAPRVNTDLHRVQWQFRQEDLCGANMYHGTVGRGQSTTQEVAFHDGKGSFLVCATSRY